MKDKLLELIDEILNTENFDLQNTFSIATRFHIKYIRSVINDHVILTNSEYIELQNNSRKLHALEAAGVDNWEGYSYMFDIMEEWDAEEEE